MPYISYEEFFRQQDIAKLIQATYEANKEVEKRSRSIRTRDDDRRLFRARMMYEGAFHRELLMDDISSRGRMPAVFRSKTKFFPRNQVSRIGEELPLFSNTQP